MTQPMEKVIRPFQLGEIFTARRASPQVPPTGQTPEAVVVTWGKPGQANFVQWTFAGISRTTSVYTEEGRVTDTVRVFQNNDESSANFVDVERIRELTVRNQEGQQLEIHLNGDT